MLGAAHQGLDPWTLAFVPVESTYRTQDKPDGAGVSHTRGAGFVTADLIGTVQTRGAKRRREDSLVEPFDYYMTNNTT